MAPLRSAAELTDNLKMRKKEYGNYLSDFYLEKSVMQLKVVNNHFAEGKLSGSKTDEDYQHLMRYVNPAFDRIFKLENELKTATGATNLISDSLWFCKNKVKKFLLDFIKNNEDSYISILAIQRLTWLKQMSDDSVLSTFNLLTPRINRTIAARKYKESLIHAINSSIGHFSSDFKRKDVNGQTITLSSFKGNYVLLDFWASWCAPCRAKTPFVKGIYEKYNFKGLKVIAISCDLKYNAWEKAIAEDSMQRFINVLSFTDTWEGNRFSIL